MSGAPARLDVLVAWELGGNLGHLLRTKPVASVLSERGHAVTWAVPDPAAATALLDGQWREVLRVPRYVLPTRQEPACYAEILAAHGFGDDAMLSDAMSAWSRLLAHVRPDVMLVDHSPLALLAARLHRVPALHLATGWESPPAYPHLPVLRHGAEGSAPAAVRALETRLLDRINRLCRKHDAPTLDMLAEIFRAEATLLTAVPETDHFAPRPDRPWFQAGDPRRQPVYVGPLYSGDSGAEPEWPVADAPRVYVYLQRGEAAGAVLRTLEQTRTSVIAVVPGADGIPIHSARRLHRTPVKLDQTLREADLVICHGSHGVVAASLLAGVPVLVLPSQYEQGLLGERVQALGAGLVVPIDHVGDSLRVAIDRLLREPRHCERARAIAESYRGFAPNGVAQRVAWTVEDMGHRFSPRLAGKGNGAATREQFQ